MGMQNKLGLGSGAIALVWLVGAACAAQVQQVYTPANPPRLTASAPPPANLPPARPVGGPPVIVYPQRPPTAFERHYRDFLWSGPIRAGELRRLGYEAGYPFAIGGSFGYGSLDGSWNLRGGSWLGSGNGYQSGFGPSFRLGYGRGNGYGRTYGLWGYWGAPTAVWGWANSGSWGGAGDAWYGGSGSDWQRSPSPWSAYPGVGVSDARWTWWSDPWRTQVNAPTDVREADPRLGLTPAPNVLSAEEALAALAAAGEVSMIMGALADSRGTGPSAGGRAGAVPDAVAQYWTALMQLGAQGREQPVAGRPSVRAANEQEAAVRTFKALLLSDPTIVYMRAPRWMEPLVPGGWTTAGVQLAQVATRLSESATARGDASGLSDPGLAWYHASSAMLMGYAPGASNAKGIARQLELASDLGLPEDVRTVLARELLPSGHPLTQSNSVPASGPASRPAPPRPANP